MDCGSAAMGSSECQSWSDGAYCVLRITYSVWVRAHTLYVIRNTLHYSMPSRGPNFPPAIDAHRLYPDPSGARHPGRQVVGQDGHLVDVGDVLHRVVAADEGSG